MGDPEILEETKIRYVRASEFMRRARKVRGTSEEARQKEYVERCESDGPLDMDLLRKQRDLSRMYSEGIPL